MSDDFINEISPELISIQALNAHSVHNAPARCVMFGGHFAQRPVIDGSEPNQTVTGVEEEMGKYTFSVKMPEDGTIVAKIQKYAPGVTEDSINFNPETLVIYQAHATGRYGCFVIPYHCSHDPVFGFRYDIKPTVNALNPGADIPKGVVFADSPAVKGESHYTSGKMLNMAYLSVPNVGLDGYVISRDVLHHFKFRLYEKRVVEFGSNDFPLNMFGTDEVYQPFPEIGDYLPESGLLGATRRFDPIMAPALTSIRDARRIDYQFDNPIFARPGKGRVIDVTAIESPNITKRLPLQMTRQLEKYKTGYLHYCREILRLYRRLAGESRKNGGNGWVEMTEELKHIIVHAMAIAGDHPGNQPDLTLLYKKKQLDGWRVEFTIEYEVIPTRGNKLTCMNGGGLK